MSFTSSLSSTPAFQVSFEFFPPKNAEMEAVLWASIQRLSPINPAFVSVTYGAGGSTRERTHATISRLKRETALAPAAHLTCVAATRAEVDAVARSYVDIGVSHIVALRGDPLAGIGTAYVPHPDGYAYASDLVAGLKRLGNFEISVAAYPEAHPESPDVNADIENLKRKVDAGADRAITQFFFDNEVFLRYRDRVAAAGIAIPVIPGIAPVHNFKQVASFAARCGASVPKWLAARFEGLEDDATTRQLVAAAVATEQVFGLVNEGIENFHFYTMNRAELVYAICHMLGVKPQKNGVAA
jgi:methylenetetrahydrofolate reductase (NADPH)